MRLFPDSGAGDLTPTPDHWAGSVAWLRAAGMARWAEALPAQLAQALGQQGHGDWPHWQQHLAALPVPATAHLRLDAPVVEVGTAAASAEQAAIRQALIGLRPWRKGPFRLHGVLVDSEWRSDWKWGRLAPHLRPLPGRRVLDVGSGNGYYAWRMLGAGAAGVVALDPTQLFLAQFLAVRRLVSAALPADDWQPDRAPGEPPAALHFLPLGVEAMPDRLQAFDTVFSMGVLYHRRSPIDHLRELRGALRPGGELVLETLCLDAPAGQVLVPAGRYAKMRNVWFIPAVAELVRWLQRVGFREVQVVDLTRTTVDEQRRTAWMPFESLADFLDPQDPQRTCEGYPAPTRATVLATAP